MQTLPSLYQHLAQAGLVRPTQGLEGVLIEYLAHDSRKVRPGSLFVAVRGGQADGHLFIDKAVKKGAIAVVCEAVPAEAISLTAGTVFVPVIDSKKALAVLASAWFGHPAQALQMVGVTGTNGKTTTAFLVQYLLQTLGQKTGLVGTVQYDVGGPTTVANMTTPDALELHGLLAQMVQNGCVACAMEVSSHALDQARAEAIDFNVAVFTNLTRDHLDYHHSFEAYCAAKKRLFDGLRPEATALYNADDPAGEKVVADTRAQRVSYGCSAAADWQVAVLANETTGLHLRIDGQTRRFRLVGLFNAYNVLAAYGAGRALGFPATEVLDALAEAPPVPGRFAQLRFEDGTVVIIDYAHTPDALENVLLTARALKPETAQLWCVFGCGGDRDPSKRRVMGALAEQYADRVIVTSDNPRTEDPEAILNDIRRGMNLPVRAHWIADRRAAIDAAAALAQPGDVVLLAGKGHETYQIIGTDRVHLDDREEVLRAFGSRGWHDPANETP